MDYNYFLLEIGAMHSTLPELRVDIDKVVEFNFCFVQIYKSITQEVHFQIDHPFCASTLFLFVYFLILDHNQ